ncbi:ABC transporter permease [Kibdelosporangium phytohabitans]|uniref:Transporter n=1 Tax=Kibdelosporangium phytohabitans TaxID=860235 RepID=A0A0N7F2E3_9PSEU|nr:ABC transporter permease subunit [Kibdelosporangium phytohabitans]ALG05591.1 hypothetical protein AOZ06_00400 [Kibdelosporangium phytohabitans]MBE1466443.1 hypothetical protein [Kibdelosporangium phytohabitans]
MIWVSWRRQRAQLITLLGMLVIGGGLIALLRSNMIDTIESLRLTNCVTQSATSCPAAGSIPLFATDWTTPLHAGQAVILFLPVLIGVFIGAPLFARELEQGTHVLAFTQSVSRTRWMISKLVVALAPALIVLIALQNLVSWWLSAAGLLGPRNSGSLHFLNYGIEHVSPAAFTLFAFAVGAFLGVVSRRTLVAMTAGLGAFVVLRLAMSELVMRVLPVHRVEYAAGVSQSAAMGEYRGASLTVGSGWIDAAGREMPSKETYPLLQACKSTPGGTPRTQEEFLACLPRSGLVKQYVKVIPENQVWQAHLYDAAVFGGLAVLLLVGAGWALRRQS